MHPQPLAFSNSAASIAWLCACSALSLFPCSLPSTLARRGLESSTGTRSMHMRRTGHAAVRGAILTGLRGGGGAGGGGGTGLSALRLGSWAAGRLPPANFLKAEKLGDYCPYYQSSIKRQMDMGGQQDAPAPGEAINTVEVMVKNCAKAFDLSRAPGPLTEAERAELTCSVTALTASDLGVVKGDSPGKTIAYTDIYDGDDFTVCMFRLPAGARLPMHDHPGMVVFSKVVYGELGVVAYDRADSSAPPPNQGPKETLNRVLGVAPPAFQVNAQREDEVWTAADGAQFTGPNAGNIHQFKAITDCCVVDVLAPPYDVAAGRRCTYYEIEERADGTTWAQPTRCPSDYFTTSMAYTGLPFNR